MKTVIVLGLSTLILSMDVEASLSNLRPEVQPDPPISAQASPWAVSQRSVASENQLARVYIDFGIHAPIGRHGRIDLYFGGPSHYYGYPSHYRYRHHYRYHKPYYKHRQHRPYYRHHKPYYKHRHHHYKRYPHHWKRDHYRKYDHRRDNRGPSRRHGHW